VNYYFPAKGTMIFLNYIMKTEKGDGNEVDNDQVLIQFQIAF